MTRQIWRRLLLVATVSWIVSVVGYGVYSGVRFPTDAYISEQLTMLVLDSWYSDWDAAREAYASNKKSGLNDVEIISKTVEEAKREMAKRRQYLREHKAREAERNKPKTLGQLADNLDRAAQQLDQISRGVLPQKSVSEQLLELARLKLELVEIQANQYEPVMAKNGDQKVTAAVIISGWLFGPPLALMLLGMVVMWIAAPRDPPIVD